LATACRPHPLQHVHGDAGVFGRPRFPAPFGDLPTTTWRPLRGRGKSAAGVVPRPTRHPHHLAEDPALVLLRSLQLHLRVSGSDLGTRRHR